MVTNPLHPPPNPPIHPPLPLRHQRRFRGSTVPRQSANNCSEAPFFAEAQRPLNSRAPPLIFAASVDLRLTPPLFLARTIDHLFFLLYYCNESSPAHKNCSLVTFKLSTAHPIMSWSLCVLETVKSYETFCWHTLKRSSLLPLLPNTVLVHTSPPP